MKYRFITALFNMKLDKIKHKGIQIFPGARISNSSKILSETMETRLMQTTVGIHSIDEFTDTVYFYIDGVFKNVNNQEQMDAIGVENTFLFLRQAQHFIHHLWELKDNNIYVRDGFLIAYEQNFEDGCTYKASLSEIFSLSTCEKIETNFSDSEISSAIKDFVPPPLEYFGEESIGGMLVNSKHFFKANGYTRVDRAYYFTINARKSAILPMKIVAYCNALESLFTIGTSEVNHKIAERVAVLLGSSEDSKKRLFKLIKNAYNYRSKIVHGQHLKGTDDDLVNISKGLDDILRKLFVNKSEVFLKSDEEMELFFLDLLFANS